MKHYKNRIFFSMFWILLGTALLALHLAGIIEEFWSSMGITLIIISILQMIRHIRYRTDRDYQEKVDIASQDERNRFLANKAWAWAGYCFVLTAACGTIVFKLLGREELMMLASGSVCLILVFYWLSYMFLRKKY